MSLINIVESLLLTSNIPLSTNKIINVIKNTITKETKEDFGISKLNDKAISDTIKDLNKKYDTNNNSFFILERKNGWLMCARAEYSDFIATMLPDNKPPTLSPAALETLAIVAYKEKITKGNLEDMRGVNCDGVINKLLEREMITISGKLDIPGRPLLYSVTQNFYNYFGIKGIGDLPNLEELNQIKK